MNNHGAVQTALCSNCISGVFNGEYLAMLPLADVYHFLLRNYFFAIYANCVIFLTVESTKYATASGDFARSSPGPRPSTRLGPWTPLGDFRGFRLPDHLSMIWPCPLSSILNTPLNCIDLLAWGQGRSQSQHMLQWCYFLHGLGGLRKGAMAM